jgi:hypothetical protein
MRKHVYIPIVLVCTLSTQLMSGVTSKNCLARSLVLE